MHDAELVIQRGLGNEQVGDGRPMPHAVMVGEVALQPQCAFEDVRRGVNGREAVVKLLLERVVVARRAGGIELLELADRADVEISGQFGQLRAHNSITAPHRRALVEQPPPYRHMPSDASTSRSTHASSDASNWR